MVTEAKLTAKLARRPDTYTISPRSDFLRLLTTNPIVEASC
jgi:hypothetical protein